jgi:hypothetical protein
MINPQKGIDLINNDSIINRILFVVKIFQHGQELIKPRGSSSDTVVVLGVRESNLYRLKGHPMRAMASSSKVAENKEQVFLKVE